MITSLNRQELMDYVDKQLNYFFPDKTKFKDPEVECALDLALDRIENCFKHILLRGYRSENGEAIFSHMHTDQYSQFLYFLSNSLWNEFQRKEVCDKLIALNKVISSMFFSYKCELPDIFLFGHPVGTIIGNASYSDGLVIFQNVTINTDVDDCGNPAPKLGKGLFLGAGSKIIGNQPIGDRVSLGVDAMVYGQQIESDRIVLRDRITGEQKIIENTSGKCKAQDYFDIEF